MQRAHAEGGYLVEALDQPHEVILVKRVPNLIRHQLDLLHRQLLGAGESEAIGLHVLDLVAVEILGAARDPFQVAQYVLISGFLSSAAHANVENVAERA